jgi:hypothetical protein
MNYAALFAFIIRLVGVYFLYSATAQVIVFLSAAGFPASSGVRMHFGWSSVLSLIGHVLAAMWFFKGAPPYSGWAYKELADKKDNS